MGQIELLVMFPKNPLTGAVTDFNMRTKETKNIVCFWHLKINDNSQLIDKGSVLRQMSFQKCLKMDCKYGKIHEKLICGDASFF
jgi:hypothetical protein